MNIEHPSNIIADFHGVNLNSMRWGWARVLGRPLPFATGDTKDLRKELGSRIHLQPAGSVLTRGTPSKVLHDLRRAFEARKEFEFRGLVVAGRTARFGMHLQLSFRIYQSRSPGLSEVFVSRGYSASGGLWIQTFLAVGLVFGLIGAGWLPPESLLVPVPAVVVVSVLQSIVGPRSHNALASRAVAIIASALKDRVVASIEEGERELGQLSVPDTSDEIRGAVSPAAERGDLSHASVPPEVESGSEPPAERQAGVRNAR